MGCKSKGKRSGKSVSGECQSEESAAVDSGRMRLGFKTSTAVGVVDWVAVCPDDNALRVKLREMADASRRPGGPPPWRLAFDLARLLRRWGDRDRELREMEPVAYRFALALYDGAGEFLETFEECWAKVRTPVGADRWAEAVRLARESPLLVAPDPGMNKVFAASVAAYLSNLYDAEPFTFCGEKLAAEVGVPARTGYRMVDNLVRRGVIRWHDKTWSFKQARARLAVFAGTVVGPLPEDHPCRSIG